MGIDSTLYSVFLVLIMLVSMLLTNGIRRFFPRSFSVISSAKVILPMALGLNLLDGLSTWLCLTRGGKIDMEGNSFLRLFFEQFGVGTSLLVGKVFLFSIAIVFLLRVISLRHLRVALVLFLFLLCLSNLTTFFLMGPA